MSDTYHLLDSGNGKKLEQFGSYRLIRPAAAAIWNPRLPQKEWDLADGVFSREGKSRWHKRVDGDWRVKICGIVFKLSTTDFGHLGVFPEHQRIWSWLNDRITKNDCVLNLFAYSGGATLAAARAGAEVCHVDASKGMVDWARENALLNNLQSAPIRWIVDDVLKFLKKEVRRKRQYEGIVLDPPTFGRGSQGQVFKIERDLPLILELCARLSPRYIALSCHTGTYTPLILKRLLEDFFSEGKFQEGEMMLLGPQNQLPNGTFARWTRD